MLLEPGTRKYPRRDNSFRKGNTRFPSVAAMTNSPVLDSEPGPVDSKNVWASLSQIWNEEENPQRSMVRRQSPSSPGERVSYDTRSTRTSRLNQGSSRRVRRAPIYGSSRRHKGDDHEVNGESEWVMSRKRGRESDSESDTEIDARSTRKTVRDRLGSRKADEDSDDDERWTAR